MTSFDGIADSINETLKNQPDNENLKIAASQYKELEENLEEVFKRTKGNQPMLMSKESLETLVSYLEHMDYIQKHEQG